MWKGDDLIFEGLKSLEYEIVPQQQCRIIETPSLRFPLLRRGNQRTLVPLAQRGEAEGGGQNIRIIMRGEAIGSDSGFFYPLVAAFSPRRYSPIAVCQWGESANSCR